MIKLKKTWIFLLGLMIVFWINLQYTHWLETRDNYSDKWTQSSDRPSEWKIGDTTISDENPIWNWSTSMSERSKWILQLPQPENYETKLWYIMNLIYVIINRTLWILTFVVLVYMLYNWFLILTAGSDEKNSTKWKGWIKTAIIAIVWIGISRLIISAIIRFIDKIT